MTYGLMALNLFLHVMILHHVMQFQNSIWCSWVFHNDRVLRLVMKFLTDRLLKNDDQTVWRDVTDRVSSRDTQDLKMVKYDIEESWIQSSFRRKLTWDGDEIMKWRKILSILNHEYLHRNSDVLIVKIQTMIFQLLFAF